VFTSRVKAGLNNDFIFEEEDMSFMQEFKDFAMRGNVVDLAVGVVIGGAFGKIVDSLVKDIIMPMVGAMMGGVDFKQLYINLGATTYDTMELAEKAGAPLVKYGMFINSMVDFVIIAFAIFVAVKAINSLKRKQEAAPAAPAPTPEDVVLLREIRDALKK
jgi:large conductance mechanosensitive channel